VVHGRLDDGKPMLEAVIPPDGGRGPRVRIESVRRRRKKGLEPRMGQDGSRIVRLRVEVVESRRDLSLVRVKITRGFRHQVRAVLAAVGHPIIGDRVYDASAPHSEHALLLHASRIVYPHPDDGRLVRVDSDPGRLRRAWDSMQHP